MNHKLEKIDCTNPETGTLCILFNNPEVPREKVSPCLWERSKPIRDQLKRGQAIRPSFCPLRKGG